MVRAAGLSLQARRWTGMLAIVEAMARDGRAKATATPRTSGTLTVLAEAFFQNAFVHQMNPEHPPLVAGDIKKPMQTGFVLLGEARGQQARESGARADA